MTNLTPEEVEILKHVLIEDEGLELQPYMDCCSKPFKQCGCKVKGKLTIGCGRNIEDIGISENEAIGLLLNDIQRCSILVQKNLPWFTKLNSPRRIVILSMAFNLGISGLKNFKKMFVCIESGDFLSASNEMLKSEWADQVKGRATRLAEVFKTGEF